ncbi:hypothetical protein DFP72DRAFT_1128100 [Ephemerocybe angulata]|uniref:Uncharacterized protein n=1 Tax=Ephemerocybe angulata TaxID=980116 RepID=A0A8H6M713_9AGAR|nr:hypothetical protein DFP72DRAFT_1128100 [Tulosesus angulatus]
MPSNPSHRSSSAISTRHSRTPRLQTRLSSRNGQAAHDLLTFAMRVWVGTDPCPVFSRLVSKTPDPGVCALEWMGARGGSGDSEPRPHLQKTAATMASLSVENTGPACVGERRGVYSIRASLAASTSDRKMRILSEREQDCSAPFRPSAIDTCALAWKTGSSSTEHPQLPSPYTPTHVPRDDGVTTHSSFADRPTRTRANAMPEPWAVHGWLW